MPAWLLPLLFGGSALANLFGAHKGAKAAEKASQQQQAAAQQAIRYQEPLYNQALQIAHQQAQQGQARYAPYAQTGGQGLVALSSLLGLPAPRIPAESTIPPPGPAPGPAGPARSPYQAMVLGQASSPQHQAALERLTPAQWATIQGGGSVPHAQVGLVTLKAPNGQTKQVPADQADYYVSRGATRA